MRTTFPFAIGTEQAGGSAGSVGAAPSSADFGRLLEARRREAAPTTESRTGGRRRSAVDRPDRRPPSGDDEVRAARATARLGGKRTARADRPDRPDRPERPPERPVTNRVDDAAASAAASAAPAQDAPADGTSPATGADPAGTTPVGVQGAAPGSNGDTTTGAASAAMTAAATAASPAVAGATPTTNAPAPTAPNAPTVASAAAATPVDPVAQNGSPATDASTAAAPGATTPAAASSAAPGEGVSTDGAVAVAAPATGAAGAPGAPTHATDPATVDTPIGIARPSTPADGDDAGTGADGAPGRGSAAAGSEPPARAKRDVDPPTNPGAPTATPGAPAAPPLAATPVTVMRSGAVARAMEAATRADQAPSPLTSRLAVELDDTTRVAVRVHGQAVRIDVIEDPNTRLDASWRRDVAEGIRRHGLEYERQGADANDRRNRRDADEERMTARDGGTRIRRRFAIDLNTATSS